MELLPLVPHAGTIIIYRAVRSKNVMVKLIVYNNESATGVVLFSV